MKKKLLMLGLGLLIIVGGVIASNSSSSLLAKPEFPSGNNLDSVSLLARDTDGLFVSLVGDNNEMSGYYTVSDPNSYSKLVLTPGTNDGGSTLNSAKLVIKVGQGLKIVEYPTDITGTTKIKDYVYNYIDNTLTYWFADGLSTTDLPPMNLTVASSGLAGKEGNEYNVSAELTGKKNSGEDYFPANSDIFKITTKNVSYRKPTTDNFKFYHGASVSTSAMPGGSIEVGEFRSFDGELVAFENLILKMTAHNDAAKGKVGQLITNRTAPITFVGPQDQYSRRNRLVNTEYSSDGSQIISEAGQMDIPGGVNGFYMYYMFGKVPDDAIPGTVYEIEMSYYDGNEFVTSQIFKIQTDNVKTVAGYNDKAQEQVAPGNGFVDLTVATSLTTGGSGVSDFDLVYNVPEKLIPESFSSNTVPTNAQVFYQYSEDDTWNLLTDRLSNEAGLNGYTFSKVANKANISKIKLFTPNRNISFATQYTPAVLKYSYNDAKVGETFKFPIESASYYDVNEKKQVELAKVETKETKVVDFDSDVTVGNYLSNTISNKSYVNGETLNVISSLGVESYHPLESPYKFIILPKGLEINESTVKQLTSITIQNDYSRRFDGYNTAQIIDGNSYNLQKKLLSDGSTIYFWKKNNTMSRVNDVFFDIWKQTFDIEVKTASVGKYKILSGMGDLYSDKISSPQKSSISSLSSEIQEELANFGMTSTQSSIESKEITIDSQSYIEIKSKVKLTTEDKYKDVTDTTSLMEVVPGQAIDYQAEILNSGTTEMKDVSIIDILPYKDDTNILSSVGRDSQFRLFLTGEVKDFKKNGIVMKNQEYLIEYSTSNTPDRWNSAGQVVSGEPWGELSNTITEVQAFKLGLKESLLPGDSVILNFKLQVPADAPRSSEEIKYQAHNTIAYHSDKSTAESNWARVQTKEPGALEIAGRVFNDTSLDGQVTTNDLGFDNVKVELYRKVGNKYEFVEERTTIENETTQEKGHYVFNETLIDGGTYKVKVDFSTLIDEGYTPLQINNTFASVELDKDDPTIGWLTKDGKSEFIVGDSQLQGYAPKYELNAPVFKATGLSTTVGYQYLVGDLSKKKILPSKGMTVSLQKADGTSVKGNDNKDITAIVGNYGVADFGKIPLAVDTDYQLAYPNSRAYGLKYVNDPNKASVTYNEVDQTNITYAPTVTDTEDTLTLGFKDVDQGDAIIAKVFTTSYNVLRFGEVSESLEFGVGGILPLSVFNKRTRPEPFNLEVEDTRVVKEKEKWKVSAMIATDLQAVEDDEVVASLPGVLEYAQTKDGKTTGTPFVPGIPLVIHEETGINETDPDYTINISDGWSNTSGLVINVPAGVPKLKTYTTDITWTLTAAPY